MRLPPPLTHSLIIATWDDVKAMFPSRTKS